LGVNQGFSPLHILNTIARKTRYIPHDESSKKRQNIAFHGKNYARNTTHILITLQVQTEANQTVHQSIMLLILGGKNMDTQNSKPKQQTEPPSHEALIQSEWAYHQGTRKDASGSGAYRKREDHCS
jgi:hypothetical protein